MSKAINTTVNINVEHLIRVLGALRDGLSHMIELLGETRNYCPFCDKELEEVKQSPSLKACYKCGRFVKRDD